MRLHNGTIWYPTIVLTLIVLLSGCSLRLSPPSSEDAKEFLYQNKEGIEVIVDYLMNLRFNSAFIDKDDGTIFYNYEYHDIPSEEIRSCIRSIWQAGCTKIKKEDVQEINTISFEIWHRTRVSAQ